MNLKSLSKKYTPQPIADNRFESPEGQVEMYQKILPNIVKRLINTGGDFAKYSGDLDEVVSSLFEKLYVPHKHRDGDTRADIEHLNAEDDERKFFGALTNWVRQRMLDKSAGDSKEDVVSEKYEHGTGSYIDNLNTKQSAGGLQGTEATADMGSQSGAYIAEDKGLLGKTKEDLEDAILNARDRWDEMSEAQKKSALRIYKSTRKKLQADGDDLDPAVVEIYEDLKRDPALDYVQADDDSPVSNFKYEKVKLRGPNGERNGLPALKVTGCKTIPTIPGYKYLKSGHGAHYFVKDED